MHTPHIAVIGAGIAGLSCATQLEALGMRVSVFDKSRGTGGRMSTRRGDGWQADHGAQYFTARDPLFLQELDRWQQAGVADLWQPDIAVLGDGAPHRNDGTTRRYVGVPRMSSPARWLADALTVNVSARVIELVNANHRWQLRFDDATDGRAALESTVFDAVVLAIPPAQAADLTRPHAAATTALCESLPMRPCWAVMLQFNARVALPFAAAFVNAGPLRWIARDSSKPGRPARETWTLHATTHWSEQHLEDSADDVIQALVAALTTLGGPAPESATAHRWRYSEPDAAPDARVFVWDAALKLGLCGDWLHGGRVEGAWLSGRAVARAILSAE
ncbi:MAG: NAD/FAD-dependent oxidoreductase [Gammaproteobacteria bacterium]|nr:NAD/FAD-dependent oxidoreductase [Gammaproteobacteria bacterium]